MHLVLVGLSHHAAPIEIRERLTCTDHRLQHALEHARSCAGVREILILSTCNRMEVYALTEGPDPVSAYAGICRHLSAFHNVPELLFEPYLYRKAEQDVVSHLLRVASGLDSLVLGEAQILGQVRFALRSAHRAGAAGGVLSRLFQQALTCGKRVQQETGLGRGAFSIGHTAVDLASRIFTLKDANVLILGAGKMSVLTARHLAANGVKVILVANRTYERAVVMAEAVGGTAISYDDFPDYLTRSDIVISSTAAPHPIIRRDMLLPVLRKRRGKPLFIIDIAVPRDVEADVADLDNVFLYNIDHLQEVVAERFKGRAAEAVQAEQIVTVESAEFLNWYRAREAAPVIKQLKERLDDYADKRLAILRAGISGLSARDWALVEMHIASLMDEVAREPILRLKRASTDAANASPDDVSRYDLLSAAREIFGLGVEDTAGTIEETIENSIEKTIDETTYEAKGELKEEIA